MTTDSTPQIGELYRENGPGLLAYFLRRHGQPQIAEDLLQDTFAQALKHHRRLMEAGSPRAYLFGIARNLSNHSFRRNPVLEELAEEPPAASIEGEDPRLEPMREAIGRLPEVLHETLELRLTHELSYEEIAQVLNAPIGTVRSRLHAAVQQLRQTLNPPAGSSHVLTGL